MGICLRFPISDTHLWPGLIITMTET